MVKKNLFIFHHKFTIVNVMLQHNFGFIFSIFSAVSATSAVNY